MTRRLLPIVGLFAVVPSLVLAQAPQKRTPTPEHEKLGYFVGKWKGEAEAKQSSYMPAGRYTSSDSCEWFEGHFAVVCRGEGTNPRGPSQMLGLLSYSPEDRVYTYYGIGSSGMTMTSVAKGTMQGGTWVYTEEGRMGGKTVQSRYTIRETSPTAYSFMLETKGDDGRWTTVLEGKQTKVSGEPMRRARTGR